MSALTRLMDAAVERCEPANDSALAKRLGVTRAAVSAWRRGEAKISSCHLAALAEAAGRDPGFAVEVLKEQATTEPERIIWGTLWERLMPIMSSIRLTARKAVARLRAH